jgi:hypothetical protein
MFNVFFLFSGDGVTIGGIGLFFRKMVFIEDEVSFLGGCFFLLRFGRDRFE